MTKEDYELLERFILSRELGGVNGVTYKKVLKILENLEETIEN